MNGEDIGARLEAAGRTKKALAAHLGKSVHAVGRLTKSKRELSASDAAKIEVFFGPPIAAPATVRIPVFGYAGAGGPERISLAGDDVLEEMEIPVGMVRGQAFGVRIAGDSMEPRLFSGETVIVQRKVAPARYGDCVVEMQDGTALVKQYRGQRDGKVHLFQYNPEKEFFVDGAAVQAIHAVAFRR